MVFLRLEDEERIQEAHYKRYWSTMENKGKCEDEYPIYNIHEVLRHYLLSWEYILFSSN